MRNILFACLALSLLTAASPASAQPKAQKHKADAVVAAKALLKRLKGHEPKKVKPRKVTDTPLLQFLPSPSTGAVQGQPFTVLIESINNFTGRILSIDYSLNGGLVQSAPLIDNVGMFAAYLGIQTLVSNNYLDVTLYAESSTNNTDLRTAIKNLDTSINHLTTQINADRDPVDRANLEEQRNEQIALKNELVSELKAYRIPIGVQRFNYSVVADSGNQSAPSITSISPIFGDVRGGAQLTINGANFTSPVSVKIGGLPALSATYLNATTIQAVAPDFGANGSGPKDVELDFAGSGTNAISAAGFFAANLGSGGNLAKPVAVASSPQTVSLGATVTADGSQSYANRATTLDYTWTVASAPLSSAYVAGQNVGSAPSVSIAPDSFGTYILQLVVVEHDTAERLVSAPSLAVVQVVGGPQPVATPISVTANGTGTSRVLPNGANPGSSFIYSISSSPTLGTASVSLTGTVTYHAGPTTGSDTLTVQVTDQSGLTGSVDIPVTITDAAAPKPSAAGINTHTEPGHTQIIPNGVSPNNVFTYQVVSNPSHGTASVSNLGFVTYGSSAGYTGTDSFIVEVTDGNTPPLSGIVTVQANVVANSTPHVFAPNILIAQDTVGTSQASKADDVLQTGLYSIGTPAHGSATISPSGLVTYTPASGYYGTDSVQVSFTDNGNPTLTGSATISVTVNAPPTASAPGIRVNPGYSATSQVSASDPNGDSLTYSIATAPAHGSATVSSSGLVTLNEDSAYTGSDSIVVQVTDSGTPALSTTVSIPVTSYTNNPPTASAPSISLPAGTTATSQVSASDPDQGTTFTYAISTAPSHGTASVSSTGLVSYSTPLGAANTDSIGVTVSDSGNPILSATISIPVTIRAHQAPTVPSPLFYRLLSPGVPYQVGLSLSGNATPSGGVVSPTGQTISSMVWDFGDGTHEKTFDQAQASLTHNYVATGTYTATFTATDNLGAATSGTISVNVVNTDIPTAKFTANPSNGGGGTLPLTVSFDASASSGTGTITQYRWLFCGQNPEVVTTTPTVSRTFTSAPPNNTCQVRLRTRYANFAEGQSIVPITIGASASGAPSQAQFFVGPPREVVLGTAHTFDGSRSFNPNVGGTIASYKWSFNDFVNCGGSTPPSSCSGSGVSTSYTYPIVANYFPGLQIVNGVGNTSSLVVQELFVVNSGHAPHSIPRASATSGVVPFTVTLDGSDSYSYPPATITQSNWLFPSPSNSFCTSNGNTGTCTFTTVGVYPVQFHVTDSDGNQAFETVQISATASRTDSVRSSRDYDPDREYQRQLLTNACWTGSAEACSDLADMYAEDGDTFTSSQLKEKACSMGYQPACPGR